MRVLPIDVGMTAGHQLLLDVGAINKQFCHGAPIPVGGHTTNANALAHNQCAQIVPGCSGGYWVSFTASQLGRVDAGQSDLFSSARTAGIPIPAALDRDAGVTPSRGGQEQ